MPSRLPYLLSETFRGFVHNPFMSFVVVANIGIALFFVSVFATAFLNLNRLIESAEDKITFEVFLEDKAPDVEIMRKEILNTEGVADARYISKTEAYDLFKKEVGAEILTAVDGNPLPASFKLTLRREARSPERLNTVRESLKGIPFVDEVTETKDWVPKLQRVRNIFGSVSLSVSVILCLAIFFMVFSTFRVTCVARQEFFRILELLGSPISAIKIPFVLEGSLKGLLGGFLAWGLLVATMALVRTTFPGVLLYSKIILFQAGLGLLLGCAAAAVAVGTALRSED